MLKHIQRSMSTSCHFQNRTLPCSLNFGRSLVHADRCPLSNISNRPAYARKPLLQKQQSHSLLTRCSASGNGSNTQDRFVVTTPLYYVNAAPHMGSAYPTIAADVLARFQRLRGRPVTFITGLDEHGEKIAEAAAARGVSPQEHCDAIAAEFRELWGLLDISFDSFIRTTSPRHEDTVKEILERVWQNGDIYKADYSGWYCVGCEEFKDDGEMEEGHICPTHRRPCVERSEENYFFRLTRYQQQLQDLLENNPDFVQPESRRNEVLGWVKDGIRDFSISRAAVSWGIPLPRDPQQTVYVWFDALNGYLTGLLPDGVPPTTDNILQHGWPANVHIIGKDILRFHAVYWPGMLMSAGLPLPDKVFGHGFLTKDGMKMGKSLGNVLEPTALVRAYGAEAVRYYFMKEIGFGSDGDFSEERFRNLVNAGLANSIGNLLNRTLNPLKKNFGGAFPLAAADVPLENPLRAIVAEKAPVVAEGYERLRFMDAIEAALAISARGNQYLEETAPWTALKKGSDEEKEGAKAVLVSVLETARVIAVMMSPVTPALSRRIYAQLGFADAEFDTLTWEGGVAWGGLQAGQQTPAPKPVFARLEGDFVTEPAPAVAAAALAK